MCAVTFLGNKPKMSTVHFTKLAVVGREISFPSSPSHFQTNLEDDSITQECKTQSCRIFSFHFVFAHPLTEHKLSEKKE